jgi:tetratricopeptide (TPR) repeat protein
MSEVVETIHGRRLDARYALIAKLGSGGQAEVWRAHDSVRGVDIALKVLNPSLTRNEAAWDALKHEHEISSRLNHPGILKVFAPEKSGDSIVLPMELAAGGDLRRLRGTGFLEIIPVLLEIAQALEHAHERGVVHRDLKPGNVLFDSRARVRLADFGVAGTVVAQVEAKAATAAAAASTDNGREPVKHGLSPFTASPAQLRGEPPTPADDIYGLGALAYELLSGYPPYYPNFNRRRAIEDPVPPLVPTRQIPASLNALVMRMLAKDARERPQSMRDIIDELDASLNETLIFDFEKDGESIAVPNDDADRDGPAAHPAGGARTPALSEPRREAAIARAAVDARETALPRDGAKRDAPGREPARPDPPAARAPSLDPGNRSGDTVVLPPLGARHAGVGATLRTMFVSDAPAAGGNDSATREPWGSESGKERRARTDRRASRRIEPVLNDGPDPAANAETSQRHSVPPALRPPAEQQSQSADQAHQSLPQTAGDRVARDSQGATRVIPERAREQSGSSGRQHPFLRSSLTPREPVPQHRPLSPQQRPAGPQHAQPGALAWSNIPLDGLPRVARLEPMPPTRWPWVVLGLIAGSAAAVYFWLPRFESELPPEVQALVAPIQSALTPQKAAAGTSVAGPQADQAQPAGAGALDQATASSQATAVNAESRTDSQSGAEAGNADDRYRTLRQQFDTRATRLQARGADAWGGADFATARTRAAEAAGAQDKGDTQAAIDSLAAASQLLDQVEANAPQALAAQLASGDNALAGGQQEVAGQAFDLAKTIDPNDRHAADGRKRAASLGGLLPLLADGQNAETAHDWARAAQDYSQALSIDPDNAAARAGHSRATAAFGDDSYAKAVGAGFAALSAGRLDEARTSFTKARALKPNGAEAADGLRRVTAASSNRGYTATRSKAAALEGQERWEDAEQAYDTALASDPTLVFAQEGKARAAARADLAQRLQQLIDQPDHLAAPGVREQARSLLQTAQAQSPSGPVLRSQIARLQILLPGFDKPVRLSLLSDNSTQIAISRVGAQPANPRVGSFGVFSRREITLLPGRYVVVGTRSGFRDVRREITVAPGQDIQTIKVTCSDPI